MLRGPGGSPEGYYAMSHAPRTGRILELSLDGGGYIVDERDRRRCYPFHLGLIEVAPGADGQHDDEELGEGCAVAFRLSATGEVENVWMQAEPAHEALRARAF
jgi:hypothetical protein